MKDLYQRKTKTNFRGAYMLSGTSIRLLFRNHWRRV